MPTAPPPRSRWRTIAILAVTQIVSWGSLYYAIAILAPEIVRSQGWRAEYVVGAFSWSLLIAGLAATPVGVLLDRHGGRAVMATGSLVSGIGLAALSRCDTVAGWFLAWSVLGLAMAMTMYEAAFATINRAYGMQGRKAISTLTLFGGFASTVFWPLTLKLHTLLGWRDTWLLYAALQIGLCLPLHLLLGGRDAAVRDASARPDTVPVPARTLTPATADPAPPPAAGTAMVAPAAEPAAGTTMVAPAAAPAHAESGHTLREALRHPAFWKLALAFSANSFIFSALSVHLIPLLREFGHAATLAVLLASLIGPMQVAGRVGEMLLGQRVRPQTVGRISFGALPVALLALLLCGASQWAAALFCILYGLSNGILTIVRGTLPLELFGRKHYGAIAGALAGPTLVARAAGPLAVAAVIQRLPGQDALLAMLLAASLLSLGCYLAATARAARAR